MTEVKENLSFSDALNLLKNEIKFSDFPDLLADDWYVLKDLRNQTDEPTNEWIVTFDFPKEVQNDT